MPTDPKERELGFAEAEVGDSFQEAAGSAYHAVAAAVRQAPGERFKH